MRTVTPITPRPELVTLQEAKDWMVFDFDDFDSMIKLLISSAICQGEKTTGKHLYPVKITCDGVEKTEGFTDETFPSDLKVAILQDVATGFAYRQNGVEEAVNATVNASIYTFRSHIDNPMI